MTKGTVMTKLRATLFLGAAVLAGSAAIATAADLGIPRPAPMPIRQAAPLWWSGRPEMGSASHDRPIMVEDGVYDLVLTSIDRTWTGGLGIGRYFTSNVRGDLTWDRRFETDVKGTNADGTSPFPGERRFGLKSDVFLANLYYDFDLRSHFTPYIGLGLGMVRHETTAGEVVNPCGCDAVIDGHSNWNVAGALMAGFSLAVRERFMIDAGYRFLYLGETRSGAITGTMPLAARAEDPTVEDIHAHEFRIGLRMNIR